MKNHRQIKPEQRILSRILAQELGSQELKFVRGGEPDNDDPWGCGCGGASCALVTSPCMCEDN